MPSQDVWTPEPYGYVDTDMWTQIELTRFSEALLKNDKDFYLCAQEVYLKF